jgi:hypothetical protein
VSAAGPTAPSSTGSLQHTPPESPASSALQQAAGLAAGAGPSAAVTREPSAVFRAQPYTAGSSAASTPRQQLGMMGRLGDPSGVGGGGAAAGLAAGASDWRAAELAAEEEQRMLIRQGGMRPCGQS